MLAGSKSEELKSSLEKMNIYEKINAVMVEVTGVVKGADIKAGAGIYKAVTHDDVTRTLRATMIKYGLVAVTDVMNCEVKEETLKGKFDKQIFTAKVDVQVVITNMHKPEEKVTSRSSGFSFDTQDKAVGKAISYAAKYSFLKSFMLESFDNEEDRIQSDNKSNPEPLISSAQLSHLSLLKKQGEYSDAFFDFIIAGIYKTNKTEYLTIPQYIELSTKMEKLTALEYRETIKE